MTSEANYNSEKTNLITNNGWDKGLVIFGFPASETTVKVTTAVQLVCGQDNFPYNPNDIILVTLNFDEKSLVTDKKGNKSMGVSSEEWMVMSEGKGYMPALMIEGTMYQESGEIVKWLAKKYPDKSLTADENKQVLKWIDFNLANCERIFEAEKHWGLYSLSPTKPNYLDVLPGAKDLEWQKATIQHVDKFMKTLDKHFETKNNTTYFVSDKLTLADCVMVNWPWSLSCCARLKVSTRYPNLWAHHEALRATDPPGAEEHYSKMPLIGFAVSVFCFWERGIWNYFHHIENPKYWEE